MYCYLNSRREIGTVFFILCSVPCPLSPRHCRGDETVSHFLTTPQNSSSSLILRMRAHFELCILVQNIYDKNRNHGRYSWHKPLSTEARLHEMIDILAYFPLLYTIKSCHCLSLHYYLLTGNVKRSQTFICLEISCF